MSLPAEVRALASGRNFATLTTLLPDGQPATQVMWIDHEEDHLLLNTETHRQKMRNIERDPRVTVCIWQHDDPYRYVEVRGEVVETIRGTQARAHIDACAQRYVGRDYDATQIVSERVLLRVRPHTDR